MTHRTVRVLCIVLALLAALACTAPAPPDESEATSTRAIETDARDAIEAVLAQDDELGRARNHACETDTLANAIRAYVAALDAIDFSSCPDEFTTAFRRHRDAWDQAIPLFERFDDERGELHALFERIRTGGDEARAELEAHEKAIWGTWAEVEAAARAHGALPEDDPA